MGERKPFSAKEAEDRHMDLLTNLSRAREMMPKEDELDRLEVSPDGHLGPWSRWFAVLWVLRKGRGRQTLQRWLTSTPNVSADGTGGPKTLSEVFRKRDDDQQYRRVSVKQYRSGKALVFRQLLARLNDQRKWRGLVDLAPDTLLSFPGPAVTDPQCFRRFCHWVLEGSLPLPAQVPKQLANVAAVSPAQAEAMRDVFSLLCDQWGKPESGAGPEAADQGVSEGGWKPLAAWHYVNLHGRLTPENRQRFAAHIIRQVAAKARTLGAEVGFLYIDASIGTEPACITPTDVLQVMSQALGIAVGGSLHESTEAYDKAIDAVRNALWRQPALIVLDGLTHVPGLQAGLTRLMADRDWDAFVRLLCQPDRRALVTRRDDGSDRLPTDWVTGLITISDGMLQDCKQWASLVVNMSSHSYASTPPPAPELSVTALGVAKLMVAASVDGLRQATLHRCIRRWIHIVRAEQSCVELRPTAEGLAGADVGELCKHLASGDPPLLAQVRARASLPGLTPRQRRYELQLDPRSAEEADDADANTLVIFRSDADRREFLVQYFATEGNANATNTVRETMWQTINWVLAEEALAQATGGLRGNTADGGVRARSHRRILQALHHALHCGKVELASLDNKAGREPEQWLMSAMPVNPMARLRYCFTFLYSSVVEGGDGLLTRSLGRFDVRLGLLAMFIARDPRDLIVADARGDTAAFVRSVREGWSEAISKQPHAHRELLEDIMLSLTEAAVETEVDELANCCIEQLEALEEQLSSSLIGLRNRWPELTLARLEPTWFIRSLERRVQLTNLRLDMLDSTDQVDKAIKRCETALHDVCGASLVVDEISELGREHSTELLSANLTLGILTDRLDFLVRSSMEQLLRRESDRWVVASTLIEWLGRLADFQATKADKLSDSASSEVDPDAALGFMTSWSLAYVGDSLRALVSLWDAGSRPWTPVSARPYRVYIRVSLKLGRYASDVAKDLHGTGNEQLAQASLRTARALFAHAQERVNVYTRTFHHLHKERLHAMLLQASIVRCWAHQISIEDIVADMRLSDGASTRLGPWEILNDALYYVDQAERALLQLEAPHLLARRFHLERVSILIGALVSLRNEVGHLGRPGSPDAQFASKFAIEANLEALLRVTKGRAFWSRLAARQHARWDKVRRGASKRGSSVFVR